ncbi:polysaccharide biosynthesis/export family protein [Planctomycetaceae bacterium SH139]
MSKLQMMSAVGFLLMQGCLTGCSSLTFPIRGVPANCLPPDARGEAKRDLVPIDVTQLSQPRPETYRLAAGDVLSIYVPGVIPFNPPQQVPQLPPIHFPEPGSDLQPSIGFPVAVQESGKITLPSIEPLNVAGLSVEEAAEAIRRSYLVENVLRDQQTYPVVTLLRARTYLVTVIREDTGRQSPLGNDHAAAGMTVDLPAYQNDILGALMATGGLPGLAAKNEIQVYRQSHRNLSPPNQTILIPGTSFQTLPPGHCTESIETHSFGSADLVIPMRVPRGTQLELDPNSVILESGDTIYIANRQTEVFYTAGMLPGGEHLLPRDYDVDIFAAMAIAGYSYGNAQSAGGGGGGGGGGGMMPGTGVIPSQLFIFRQRPDGTQYAIEVDLAKAIKDEQERLLVQPGDKLLLRYSCKEEILNFGIISFFTFGIRQLFN